MFQHSYIRGPIYFLALIFSISLTSGCTGEVKSDLPFLLETPINIHQDSLYPLVVCLHDANGRGTDNKGRGSKAFKILSDSTIQQKHPCFVLIAQCPNAQKWVNCYWTSGNYDMSTIEITDQLQSLNDLIDDVVDINNIDKTRIHITGQSMGSYGVWDLLIRKPNFFASASMISGGGDPKTVQSITNTPILLFHSDNDPLVPVRGARELNEEFKKLNAPHFSYSEYTNKGHNIWDYVWENEPIIDWMFQQKRKLD